MLAEMWQRDFPMADFDMDLLISEIVSAYRAGTVSPESCMEEIAYIIETRTDSKKKRVYDIKAVTDNV